MLWKHSYALHTAVRPSSCGMFVYRIVTSIDTRIAFNLLCASLFSRKLIKSVVSVRYEGVGEPFSSYCVNMHKYGRKGWVLDPFSGQGKKKNCPLRWVKLLKQSRKKSYIYLRWISYSKLPFMFLPPQGFGPEAKTRGGTLGSPACIHTRNFK